MKNKKKAPPITDSDMVALERMTQIAMLNTPMGGAIDFKKMLKNSSYATLTKEMKSALKELVKDKRVYDLGAGDLSLSHLMVKLGAREVIAIEKAATHEPHGPVKQYPMWFRQFIYLRENMPKGEDVAVLSWPANHEMDGVVDLIQMCGTAIYIGKNTDGTACAWPSFFGHMQLRDVLKYIPHPKNCFIAYGGQGYGPPRRTLGEERAGMDHSKKRTFEQAEKEL